MTLAKPPRVFLSYARSDIDIAREVRKRLESEGLSVWQDLTHLESDNWWVEIEETIRSASGVEHLVLIASAHALKREIVQREWRVAWREGRTISNVMWSTRDGFSVCELPRWMLARSFYDLSHPERWVRLVEVLAKPGRGPRRPFMAPKMGEYLVDRPEELSRLSGVLLDAKGDALTTTVALTGPGGFGKTALAVMLCNYEKIQDAFYDGILWITLGEAPNLIQKIADLVEILTGAPVGFSDIVPAIGRLREILEFRCCLLVIDDVWMEGQIRPFVEGLPFTTRLITTRRDDILSSNTTNLPIATMKKAEAIAVLAHGLFIVGAEAKSLAALTVERLGEWPILLHLVNRWILAEIKLGTSFSEALQAANSRLDEKNLFVFDRHDEASRNEAVMKTVQASLAFLDNMIPDGLYPKGFQQSRYQELAVFPANINIPINTIARLWRDTAGAGVDDTREMLKRMHSLGLLEELDFGGCTTRMHDVMSKYLSSVVPNERLSELHNVIVNIYTVLGLEALSNEEERYYYSYIPHHLERAGKVGVIEQLLMDPTWLRRKLSALRGPQSLIGDYRRYATKLSAEANLIGRVLGISSGILARDERQLVPQLIGRLRPGASVRLKQFLHEALGLLHDGQLLPVRPTFTAPDAEVVRLEGHEAGVNALTVLPGGRLVSGSSDNTLRIWDPETEREIGLIGGHGGEVSALVTLGNDRFASAAGDGVIRIWTLPDIIEIASLEGHEAGVNALAPLPGNLLVSSSWDRTIRLWDLNTWSQIKRFECGDELVGALVAFRSGYLALATNATGQSYNCIRLWDPATDKEAGRLEGHTGVITALAALSDSQLVSGGVDNTIRLWDLHAGAEISLFAGHEGPVNALAVLPDGRIASGSADRTIRLWDLDTGAEIACFQGHNGPVSALAVLPDGRIASAASEAGSTPDPIRLWETETAGDSQRFRAKINALSALRDGRIAIGSDGCAIRLWDPAKGMDVGRLESAPLGVGALTVLVDGTLVAGSPDGAIRTWGPKGETASFRAHKGGVSALVPLSDGRLASSSALGGTVFQVWELSPPTEIIRFERPGPTIRALSLLHGDRIAAILADHSVRIWALENWNLFDPLKTDRFFASALMQFPNGDVALGGMDKCIHVWDTNFTVEKLCLKGHTDEISAFALLSESHLISSSKDRTVRLWSLTLGRETACIECDVTPDHLVALPNHNMIVTSDSLGRIHCITNNSKNIKR